MGRNTITKITEWQYRDMQMSVWNDKIDYTTTPLETAWKKCRRSAKTENASMLAVFFAILNKEVKWRTPHIKQLGKAKQWFSFNPFVTKIDQQENLIHACNSAFPIDVSILTVANCTGTECDVLIFDEGGWVFKNLIIYEAYRNARPMIASSDFKHIVHLSTPARYSAFDDAFDDCALLEQKLNTKLTIIRTSEDCSWISKEFIESEERSHSDCPWYIDQNYKCISTPYGGAVFTNYYDVNDALRVPDSVRQNWASHVPTHAGVDFNGELVQHYLILIKFVGDALLILDEIKFTDLNLLFKYEKFSLELEDGLFSTPFADDARRVGLKCNYLAWDRIEKMQRVNRVRQRKMIIVDKRRCPTVWKNLQEAAYDQKERLPLLEKRTDQHGLDALLHADHDTETYLTVPKTAQSARKKALFGERSELANFY